jgi:hypothetical protein
MCEDRDGSFFEVAAGQLSVRPEQGERLADGAFRLY